MDDQTLPCELQDPSVTSWLHELKQGDDSAARRLWEFLHRRLLLLAEREVARTAPTGFDEEDVALSAFDALCRAIQQGRYAEIGDRGELWQLLTVITLNKVRRRVRDEKRIRRGGGFVRQTHGQESFLEEIASAEPDPAVVCMIQDECQRLLSRLERRELQLVALLRVEGYTNEEVARRMGCTRRTVHRRLLLIRDLWAEEEA